MKKSLTKAMIIFAFAVVAGFPPNQSAAQEDIATAFNSPGLNDWPEVPSPNGKNPDMESHIAEIVSGMTLEQKIGQMTQAEIHSVTPAQVKQFYIGSVMNGQGSWPNGDKHASIGDWLALADRYYEASMSSYMKVKVPLIWGTDAIHGHNNVFGATLFPHNIGLGAAHDPVLIGEIGKAVGKAVRATGIQWVFAPTLAVARDDRWGRTYESFSEDGDLVREYAREYIKGLQGNFGDGSVLAAAKHFLGDGGTAKGKDRGVNQSRRHDMINVHAQGYYGALAVGVQTVMASFNSWNDVAAGTDYGKIHGSRAILTDVLKSKMGFDGFVLSDWNAVAEVPGCTETSCPQAINAGVDMVMVPTGWQSFIANTVAEVKQGKIPMARIDDAVTRIVRVKMRAGLFGGKRPSESAYAGRMEALQPRSLARRAVRESLVLLKNDGGVLPLDRGKRILVVGKSADSLQNQTGGSSLNWQGTENANADFPAGDSILEGIGEAAGFANVVYDRTGTEANAGDFDAIIAVIGETPYAEGFGDIPLPATLHHGSRHPEDLEVLDAVGGKGRPVITVFLSGRPLYTNDLINRSDAFIAAWLPGTEGKGVADLLFRKANGEINQDFRGTLSFSWPGSACQTPLNYGDTDYAPQFPLGYGLNYRSKLTVGPLSAGMTANGCH